MSPKHYSAISLATILLFTAGLISWEDASSSFRERSIELTQGTNMAFSLSPDGRTYVVDLQGTLWLGELSTRKLRAITPKNMDARQPHWSPDGNHIIFQSYQEGNWHIYDYELAGGNTVPCTEGKFDHREPHFHPDGSKILLAADIGGKYEIWLLDMLTRRKNVIAAEDGFELFAPAWHPDGASLLYIAQQGSQNELRIKSRSTNSERTIYRSNYKLFGASFSGEGNQIYFVQTNDTSSQLLRIDPSKDEHEPSLVSEVGEDVFPFRPSFSGDRVFYTADGGIKLKSNFNGEVTEIPFSANVVLSRPSYQVKQRDFDLLDSVPVKGIYQPAISPNGNNVAYVALGDVWMTDQEGHTMQITDDPFIQVAPTWSNNGHMLAYASDRDSAAIWYYDLRQNKHYHIAGTPTLSSGLDWSPNDSCIVGSFNFGPRSGSLIQYEVYSGLGEKIGRSFPFSISRPSFSATGKLIAISILQPYSNLYREGINRLVIVPKDGSRSKNVPGLPHWSLGMRGNDSPCWSPDGRWMAFVSQGFLWKCAIDQDGNFTAPPEQLTSELAESISWTEASDRLLYQTPSGLKTINIHDGRVQKYPINLKYQFAAGSDKTIIQAGAYLDSKLGQLFYDKDIIISGHRITDIEDHQGTRSEGKIINARNQYVVPGLIDFHAHQGSESGAVLGRKWLAWGVTSTRDPATNPYDALNRREGQRSGHLSGPRIFFTGSPLDGNRIYYNGTYALQSREQLNLELDRAQALEYDLIKTYVRLPDDWQEMIVGRAHKLGIPVSSHELYPAASYGTDAVEHILGTSRRGYNTKMSLTFQSYSDVTDLIALSKMFFTPTVGIYVSYDYLLGKNPDLLNDVRVQSLMAPHTIMSIKERIHQVKRDTQKWQILFHRAAKMIKTIHDKGGIIVAGTDSPIIPYGLGLHLELEAYQLAGLPPSDVIRTATYHAAVGLGASADLGNIEVGKLADLIILEADPTQDVRNLRQISTIMINGRALSLKEILDEI